MRKKHVVRPIKKFSFSKIRIENKRKQELAKSITQTSSQDFGAKLMEHCNRS